MKLICLIYCIQKIINVRKIFAKKIFFIENLEFVQKNVLSRTWVKKRTTDARFIDNFVLRINLHTTSTELTYTFMF